MKTYYSKHFTIADNGHLHMDGVDLIDVAKQYGTPAYVMSESQLRENCREFTTAMKRNFGENYKVAYASKALCARFLYPILASEGYAKKASCLNGIESVRKNADGAEVVMLEK